MVTGFQHQAAGAIQQILHFLVGQAGKKIGMGVRPVDIAIINTGNILAEYVRKGECGGLGEGAQNLYPITALICILTCQLS